MSTPTAAPASSPPFEILTSRHFPEWLAQERISLAVSAYQTGKLFLLGLKPDGRLSAFERTFNRCLGLWSDGQTLWLASAFQLWRLENAVAPGQHSDGHDRLYVPRVGYTTGDVDIHDLSVEAGGRAVFVCTRFSCLATTSERHSFELVWRPPFISKLAPEDRCHLNGLALEGGRARFVTACGQADVVDGWRDRRADGGCVADVTTNTVIAEGLSMPHSPRWHRDRLWLLESGTGYFGWLDQARGRFERVTFCPGYARGLAFVGGYAVVGLSKPRRERTFSGLPLDSELAAKKATARCGLEVIDLATGDVVHWLRFEGPVQELYDVVVLPGVVRPKALGFKTDEIRYHVFLETEGRPTVWTGRPSG